MPRNAEKNAEPESDDQDDQGELAAATLAKVDLQAIADDSLRTTPPYSLRPRKL